MTYKNYILANRQPDKEDSFRAWLRQQPTFCDMAATMLEQCVKALYGTRFCNS